MSANKLSVSPGVIVVAALCFATLTGAAVYSSWHARDNEEKLLRAESELNKLKQSQSHDDGSDAATLRRLLDERDAAYIDLEDKYRQLTQQAQAGQTTSAAPARPADLARGGRGFGSNTNRTAWLDRLRQQDPERYKQMVAAREERRQRAEQAYQDQMDDLAARAANPISPDEADLVGKISDTLDQIGQLRDKMRDLRNSSNPDDPATQAQFQQTADTLRTAYQQLSTLRNQDRNKQYIAAGIEAGLSPEKAATLPDAIKQVQDNTQYRPPGGDGRFFGGPPASTTGSSQSSSTSTTTTK